jgi:hypothetical protein
VPRLINILCDTSMVYGYADQAEVIDEKLVDEMVRERMTDSLVPIVQIAQPDTDTPAPLANNAGVSTSARGTSPPTSNLSQISPEHKKPPVSPTTEKKTVTDPRQPVAIHAQAHISGQHARLKAVATQPEPDYQEEVDEISALVSEPEIVVEIQPEPAAEPEVVLTAETSVAPDASAGSTESAQTEEAPKRWQNRVEVVNVAAERAESEKSMFGNKWTLVVLLILALSVVFLLIRSMSSDSAPQVAVKAEVKPQAPAASAAVVLQPPAENSAAIARKKAIEAARQAAEQREAEAQVRRAQEAAVEAKAKAEADAKAEAEAEARSVAEAKAKVEQEKNQRLKAAAAARKAEQARVAAKARAADLEARLKAEQARAAAAEESARQAQAQARELQLKAQATQTAPQAAFSVVAATTNTSTAQATTATPTSAARTVDPELEFTTDPCQGPSARFLSTCHK